MGCGCGGSGARAGSGSRQVLTKRPGYTWNGPEEDKDAEPAETDDDSDDEA